MPAASSEIFAGNVVVTIHCEQSSGAWASPLPDAQDSANWFPCTRAGGTAPNCQWRRWRCQECRQFRAALTALEDLATGDELRAAPPDFVYGNAGNTVSAIISFDGGARARPSGDARAAGAGACLWTASRDGQLTQLRWATAALPGERWAPAAEAWGLYLAIQLATQYVSPTTPVRFVGDNAAVVRYASGAGRLRDPSIDGLVGPALNHLLARGNPVCATWVRRRFNQAADRVATAGLMHAMTLTTDAGPQTWGGSGNFPASPNSPDSQ